MSESIYEKMENTRRIIKWLEVQLESLQRSKSHRIKEVMDASRTFLEKEKDPMNCGEYYIWNIERSIERFNDTKNAIHKTEDELQKQRSILTKLERRFYAANVGPYLTYECSGEEFDYDRLIKGFIKGTKL